MDEEMRKQQGVHSNNCTASLTILDNIHTDGELVKGEEGAGQPHPNQGDFKEGVGGVCEKSHGGGFCWSVPEVVRAPGDGHENCQWPY